MSSHSIRFGTADPLLDGTCRVLAEAGQCMEGSVTRAIEMVCDAAIAGAWGIKTQLLRPETIATEYAPKYWDDDLGTKTQREAFSAAGLIDYDRWRPVRNAARAAGLAFVATPFDLDAVDALEEIDVDAYKVASGDLLFVPLLERIVDTGKPVLISTGAAWFDEVETIVERLLSRDPALAKRLVLLACSLVYPTAASQANVGRVVRLREMVAQSGWSPTLVGYSDHTTVPWTARDAASAGACLVEKHYTYAGASGPVADHGMAVDPDGLREVVSAAARGAAAFGDPSIVPTVAEERARVGARRAAYLRRDVSPGETVRVDDVDVLRPAPVGSLPLDLFYEAARSGTATYRVGGRVGYPIGIGDLDEF
jgi:sialic acid synthase SpsE